MLGDSLRGEDHVAPNVACLGPHLGNAPDDHIVDVGRVDASTVDKSIENSGAEGDRVPVTEASVLLGPRRADGSDDVGIEGFGLLRHGGRVVRCEIYGVERKCERERVILYIYIVTRERELRWYGTYTGIDTGLW